MKKILFLTIKLVFWFVYVVVVIISFVSCNYKEELPIMNTEASVEFNNNLYALYKRQIQLMNLGKTRASISGITYEDTQDIAKELDKNVQDFYKNNYKVLSSHEKDNLLSEDELDMIQLDQERFLSFVKDNFSEEMSKSINDFLNKKFDQSMENIVSNKSLNPSEKAIITVLKTYSDFRNLVEDINIADDKTGKINVDFRMRGSHDFVLQKNMCENDYMIDVRDCSFYPIAGTLVGFFSGGGSIAMGYAAYGYCLYSAQKSYNRCMRKVR